MKAFNIPSGFVLLITLWFSEHNCIAESTLQLVVTVFRHGDRTNDLGTTYPKDPYINETYYPYGYGELTNVGKVRLYKLGQKFRKLYGSFLGSIYFPGVIDPLSTDVSRAQCSLQLFLAGLFPPGRTELKWNRNLNWNPIPYKYVPFSNNQLMTFPLFFCPKYQELHRAYKESSEGLAIEDVYRSMYPYLTEETGLSVTSILQLFILYFGLLTEEEWGFALPEWSKSVYPEYLENASKDFYKTLTATPQLNQLFGGFLLKKIVSDMNKKINNVSRQPKMYIYSGHEISVVSILGALNLFYPHIPNYGACVILELHKIYQNYYVKVRYNKESTYTFENLQIPGCNIMCPLENFVTLVQNNLPADGDSCIVKEAK